MHFRKIFSTFHTNHPEKLTAISSLLNSALPMAKPLVKPAKPSAKRKRGHLTNTTKQAKEWDIRQWGFFFPILVRLKDFFSNFVSFGKDVHLAFFSNSASFLSVSSTLPLYLLSINSMLPLCLPSIRSTSPHCFLFMSSKLPPVFWFSSSVSPWVKRFFIRLILRFSSSVSYWVRKFFIQHALSSFTLIRLHA